MLSSRFLHKLPASPGGGVDALQESSIDWMPIDELAEALIESAMRIRKNNMDESSGSGGHEPRVLNMRNPHQTSWVSMLPSIKAAFEAQGDTMSVVAYGDWLEAIKMSASSIFESGPSNEDVARANPAVKLVEFFEKLADKDTGVVLEMEKALSVSFRLGGMSQVDGGMMRRWVEGWMDG